MKLKAFVLTAGLIALGANAAYAELPNCKTNLDGQIRNSGSKCTSKSYKFNTDSKAPAQATSHNRQKSVK